MELTPRRVQLSRRAGARLPANTISVARPTKWGNPFAIGRTVTIEVSDPNDTAAPIRHDAFTVTTPALAVELFRLFVNTRAGRATIIRENLAGKNLACWCALDQPCHADVLLELANSTPRKDDHS